MSALRCTVPGCRYAVRGLNTGLQELEKLGRHFAKRHGQQLDMRTLLALRLKLEAGEVVYVSRRGYHRHAEYCACEECMGSAK